MESSLVARFIQFVSQLRNTIFHAAGRDRAAMPFLFLIHNHIGRMATRFEKLFTHWRNGTLPEPRIRPQGARAASPDEPERPPAFRLPSRRGWLRQMIPGCQPSSAALVSLLNAPDLAAFLADVPRAGRILRPLCRMLGLMPHHMPVLQRPVPPRPKPAPKRTRSAPAASTPPRDERPGPLFPRHPKYFSSA
jgi:hypothetical protein